MFKEIYPFNYNIVAYGSDNRNNNKDLKRRFAYLGIKNAKEYICQELDEFAEEEKNKQNERRSSTHTKRKSTAKNERNAQMGFWMKELRGLDTLIY